jgi:hypothetical protein
MSGDENPNAELSTAPQSQIIIHELQNIFGSAWQSIIS